MTEHDEQQGPKIEVVSADAEPPKFDFGAGELADKVKALKAKLQDQGMLPETPEGEKPVEDEKNNPEKEGKPITGDAIDWSEFELPPHLAHLYPRAQVVDLPQGPKWCVVLDEFMTREKDANPGSRGVQRNEKTGEASDMSNFVTETLSEPPEQGCTEWKLVAFMPGASMGKCQVIMQRKKQVGLPDPKVIEKEEDASPPPPADPELAQVEAAAAAWAGEPAPETPYTSEPTEEEIMGAREVADTPEPNTDGAVEGE